MRLREAVVSVPLHLGGLNHNQLRRSGQSQIINEPIDNRNENSSSKTLSTTTTTTTTATNNTTGEAEEESEETTTWSSIAIARDNVLLETTNNTRNNVNNNLITPRLRRNSSVESITDCEGRHSSPEDSSHDLSPSEWSDWSEEGNLPAGCRVIVNPNYPGFQHLGPSLLSDTDDEHDSTELNEIDTQSKNTQQNDNFFNNNNNNNNNNVQDSINHLCEQNTERKFFYEKPKFNIQTVTSLYENVVPAAEKCINYVNSIEASKIDEDIFFGDLINLSETESDQETKKRNYTNIVDSSAVENKNISLNPFTILPELDIVNDVVEAETYLTHLEPDEGLADSVSENTKNQLSTATLKNKLDREVAVEVEIVELSTSVKETLQFPEIEEIPDSGKTSEFGEAEDLIVEPIDLIREAKGLPPIYQSKIGNHVTVSKTGRLVDDNTSTSSGANSDSEDCGDDQQPSYTKLEEIDLLSSIGPGIDIDLDKYVQPSVPDVVVAMETVAVSPRTSTIDNNRLKENHINEQEDTNKLIDRNLPDPSILDSRKKDKMARNQAKRKQHHHHHQSRSSNTQRRPDKRKTENNNLDNGPGGFDVYNIETAMPKIDLDAIESHLRAAREEERRRRNDREEIRRRLAMGPDAEDLRAERGRKPSLQSRLQSGMNLQICFMNETPSDTESPSSENDISPGPTPILNGSKQKQAAMRPQVLSLPSLRLDTWGPNSAPIDEADFFARQARLQTEARMALAQAKEMAHMQMEVERQRLKQSPITEMVRSSLEKVGVQLGESRRRLSRVLLTDLNVAQLQVVANDLHARIATLNEALVEGLLRRDDLHMEQDSMLVDVEDLTRYLGAKQETLKKKQTAREQQQQPNSISTRNNHQQSTKSRLKMTNRSLVSLVRK